MSPTEKKLVDTPQMKNTESFLKVEEHGLDGGALTG